MLRDLTLTVKIYLGMRYSNFIMERYMSVYKTEDSLGKKLSVG